MASQSPTAYSTSRPGLLMPALLDTVEAAEALEGGGDRARRRLGVGHVAVKGHNLGPRPFSSVGL